MDLSRLWVVEWSAVQGVGHIDTLDRVLELNRETLREGKNPGFIPVAVCGTAEEAREWLLAETLTLLEEVKGL